MAAWRKSDRPIGNVSRGIEDTSVSTTRDPESFAADAAAIRGPKVIGSRKESQLSEELSALAEEGSRSFAAD